MMRLIPISVEAYSGHKADEAPRRFLWEGDWVEVEAIDDRWHQGPGNPEWPMADYFRVLGSDQCLYLLKHDLESDDWFLSQKWDLNRRGPVP